jgi:hypothetical protein
MFLRSLFAFWFPFCNGSYGIVFKEKKENKNCNNLQFWGFENFKKNYGFCERISKEFSGSM